MPRDNRSIKELKIAAAAGDASASRELSRRQNIGAAKRKKARNEAKMLEEFRESELLEGAREHERQIDPDNHCDK